MRLQDRAKAVLGWLFDAGFEVGYEAAEAPSFGDAYLITGRGALRLRIVRDRGQEFVDVASVTKPDEWFDLALVVEALGHTVENLAMTNLEKAGEVLRRSLAEIDAAFSSTNFAATYDKLRRLRVQRAHKLFPRLEQDDPDWGDAH